MSGQQVAPTHGEPDGGARIDALDVLRGFALCGILFVNIRPVTSFGYELGPTGGTTLADPSGWLQLLVQQRFFPIFSLLFGIGFALLMKSARARGRRPRVVLARRLLVLLALGVLHQLIHPGEALASYAVVGLLVLLPSTWLPRRVVAVGAAVLLTAAVLVADGGLPLVPGLLLLGSVLVRYGALDRLTRTYRAPALLLVFSVAVAVPALALQVPTIRDSGLSASSAVAGLALAGVYTSGLLLAMRTRLRAALHAAFAPLGRMALTNYVAATPLMIVAGRVLDWRHSDSWAQVLTVAAAILFGQWVASTLWLSRFKHGPLEHLWRWATWLERPRLRRGPLGAQPARRPQESLR